MYKITIHGEGINMEKEVDEGLAYSVLGILMGVNQTPDSSANVHEGQKTTEKTSGAEPELTIGEFLEELELSTNQGRIAAIAKYLRDHRGQESVAQSDLSSLFQAAGETPPGNISRDVNKAVKKKWIAEDANNADCYRITKTGEKAISEGKG